MSVEQLSEAARSVWAKSRVEPGTSGQLSGWLPLYQHLDDAAAIALLLWDEWTPQNVKDVIIRDCGSPESARSLVAWLAGVHDVGKASPAFAIQVEELAVPMEQAGLKIDPRIRSLKDERRYVRHEIVGFFAVRDRLVSVHGFHDDQARQIASVVAAHHGSPADGNALAYAQDRSYFVGTGLWQEVRDELLSRSEACHASADSLSQWRTARLPPQLSAHFSSGRGRR